MEKNLHFIGIGGIGMSAIARILLHDGFSVSGSDVNVTRITQELCEQGARIFQGHDGNHIPEDCEAVVYSSAVHGDNPEMQEAVRRGLRVYRRAEMLAYLISRKTGVGVAGSHGKTTTSGMLATMLVNAGCDPDVVIGGMLPAIGNSNARAGSGTALVAEADESDGTFLLLHPTVAVVTNVEADHLDHYRDLDEIRDAFAVYLEQVPENGFAVVCTDDAVCRTLVADAKPRIITYALHEAADYTADHIQYHTLGEGGGVSADVYFRGEALGRLSLQVPGEHNIANALSCIAVGREFGLSFAECAEGLACFTGTGRRFERMGCFDGMLVVDDYAHHPTEIAATIRAARNAGSKKLFAVFQPHRYSRTQAMYRDFAEALSGADEVMVVELYPAFEEPIPGVDAHLVLNALREQGHKDVHYAADVEDALRILQESITDEDMLLVMGAGNVRKVSEGYAKIRSEEHGA